MIEPNKTISLTSMALSLLEVRLYPKDPNSSFLIRTFHRVIGRL